ncbi:hypothetical protein RMSM_04313 [Rhodopirellula maiorica SM1]|uniref:Uncharacterized protein n=1 Tax=Rhodopirellula maiorica SM1 TaxID=1265738 RepID=M5RTQ1_9BACT|nr:hypothetical protein RMSM_04313 [Rhodopirellula maiorica SM1]
MIGSVFAVRFELKHSYRLTPQDEYDFLKSKNGSDARGGPEFGFHL